MFDSTGGLVIGDRPCDVDDDWSEAPERLDSTQIAPSGAFAWELDWATGHPDTLSAAELVDAVVGYERIAAWAVARQQELLAAFGRRPEDGSIRPVAPSAASGSAAARAFAADEIGLALTLAPMAAAARMAHADRCDGVLRPTRDLLTLGKICPARARLILDLLTEYDDEVAAAVQARVLPGAPEQTVGQLRAAVTRAITAVVPDPEQRHKKARRERRVDLWPGRDGMATLSAYLTAPEATSSFEWITRLARGLPCAPGPDGSPGKRTSMDLRRADVLTALLTGRLIADTATDTAPSAAESAGAPTASEALTGEPGSDPPLLAAPVSAHRPLIHVTVPITALMGIDDEPGELAGFGPIPAPLARRIAADPNSVWRRLLTDPASGTLLDYGRTTYRPPAALAGFVRARDASCRFPGCRRPAASCELDHVRPWAPDGTTSEDNLCALCVRHHDLKEQVGWRVALHADRRMEWITPTGHHYWSRPVDHRTPIPAPVDRPDDPPPPTRPPRRTFEERCALDLPDPGDPPPF